MLKEDLFCVFAILFLTCFSDPEETKHRCFSSKSLPFKEGSGVKSAGIIGQVKMIQGCMTAGFWIKNLRRNPGHPRELVCSGRVWGGCPGWPKTPPPRPRRQMRRRETKWTAGSVRPGRHRGSLRMHKDTWGAAGPERGARSPKGQG